jgi:DNA-binding Xre family transcriptional regulator
VISGFQIRAGRALPSWTAARLASESGLSKHSIKRVEGMADTGTCRDRTIDAICDALSRFGVKLVQGGAVRVCLDQREYREVAGLPV